MFEQLDVQMLVNQPRQTRMSAACNRNMISRLRPTSPGLAFFQGRVEAGTGKKAELPPPLIGPHSYAAPVAGAVDS